MSIDARKAHDAVQNIVSHDNWLAFLNAQKIAVEGTATGHNVVDQFYNIANGEYSSHALNFGMVHGPFIVYLVRTRDDGVRLQIGCRWFTIEQAITHWRRRGGRRANQILAMLPHWLDIARSFQWPIPDKDMRLAEVAMPDPAQAQAIAQAAAPPPPQVMINTDYITVFVGGKNALISRAHPTFAEADAFHNILRSMNVEFHFAKRVVR